ncbi:RNA binding motif protein 12Ba [Enoplosus armatus]|uniref:RNA binding motif protein 12Ba n=1 Tax=Enoplosus armatus TaxID=215367 RepID=UPI00399589E3
MTIILRLQGLDVKAGTEDIRTFFECLHIPDGGVYIVGGSLREAFIAFTTERDAQLAMRLTGKVLKGSKVTLHISSMDELEEKLKSLLKRKKPPPVPLTVKRPRPSQDASLLPLNARPHTPNTANLPPTAAWPLDPRTANLPKPLYPDISNLQLSNAQSLDSNTAFLLGVCTVLHGLKSSHQGENNESVSRVDFPKTDSTVVSDELRLPEPTLNSRPGYVRLFGLPATATKEVICHFFRGLKVQEAIVNIKLGLNHGCLVKFASMQDACDALLFNQKSLGPICVEVRGATEKMWTSALQECENALDDGERVKPKQSPLRETASHKQKSTSALWVKRRPVKRLHFKSPKKPRPDSDSTTMESIVMVSNLPKKMTKTEIKELFGCPNIQHESVLHLLDKEGNRTDTAFLFFNCTEDYDYAMNLTGCHVGSHAIEVSSITKERMRDMMAKTHPRSFKHGLKTDTKKKPNRKRKSNPVETPGASSMNPDPAAHTCLFVRNIHADVQKSQIKMLFRKYKLKKDNIILLHDSDGKGIGEAVVRFKSQKHAAMAQRLQGQDFMGAKVLLTSINVKQMEDILARNI